MYQYVFIVCITIAVISLITMIIKFKTANTDAIKHETSDTQPKIKASIATPTAPTLADYIINKRFTKAIQFYRGIDFPGEILINYGTSVSENIEITVIDQNDKQLVIKLNHLVALNPQISIESDTDQLLVISRAKIPPV